MAYHICIRLKRLSNPAPWVDDDRHQLERRRSTFFSVVQPKKWSNPSIAVAAQPPTTAAVEAMRPA